MKVAKYCLIFAFWVLPDVAAGQAASSTGDLHAEVQRVYDFQPRKLSDAQIAQKSALLDQFWDESKVSA